tara:strand:+ start:183 stop:458 length:276 start_codon:yes stop_codon:yes gene_type:complete
MKMTLVVDTDDIQGMEAAHKMITTVCRQFDARVDSRGMDKRFSKIAFIKALRGYMKTQQDAVESEDIEFKDMRSLKGAKQYADAIWNGWRP